MDIRFGRDKRFCSCYLGQNLVDHENCLWELPIARGSWVTSATRATAKTLTQAGHVAPKFWVLDIRT